MSQYAGPVDHDTYGQYGPGNGFERGDGPVYPFQGRVTADGSSGFQAEPGRYHLYSGWFCPWAQRAVIVRTLKGLDDVVSLSYVDEGRDSRGWAFRERRGADPVNGFRFLREAYEATEPGYPGHISVPVLWDRTTGKIVSNDFPDITLDLNAAFGAWGNDLDLYPEALRPEIDALNAQVYDTVNTASSRVAGATTPQEYEERRQALIATFEQLDARLADRRFLFGDRITEADVRLWTTLVRFDLNDNPSARISERRLVDFPNLWAYARDLYQHPAFRDTTDFASFTYAGDARTREPWRIAVEPYQADWDAPHGREKLT
ncbi:glutathione-dependent reductase [Sphaerisporangium krabiense]|uniref:Glutathione S-transferase/putative glutathione S-transferase n=1 Tax=Sphaerisporangium krabiense TaxID=763782 RepID=A0A7W8Z0L3_9ACTN|nr:glutathione S-transferase C-terminal domain-containing protein [Sphaerisporangium krabiense]MBB5625263.1 glutathione S-transferase/putative glutathione S-transferase [Sphaerisporangium krabiense]GII64221.1 glutathione-dependent reductase [Sphaerisporangium krabiense]